MIAKEMVGDRGRSAIAANEDRGFAAHRLFQAIRRLVQRIPIDGGESLRDRAEKKTI